MRFKRILTQTVHPVRQNSEYLELTAGLESNLPILKYLVSLNCPVDQLKALISAAKNEAFNNWLLENNCLVINSHIAWPLDN